MRKHGSLVQAGSILAIVVSFALGTATPASALTVSHSVDVAQFDTHWTCPGRDPVEHATTTVRTVEFEMAGVRVRTIEHWLWKGRLENRETGALTRDDGAWTTTMYFGPTGRHVVRSVTTGSVWRFTVPGEGIVVHQTGRQVTQAGEDFESTFGGLADQSLLCSFV